MEDHEITFFCPECGTELAVAVELAGVEGPCPSCYAVIKAPVSMVKNPSLTPMPAPVTRRFPKMIGTSAQAELDFGLDETVGQTGSSQLPEDGVPMRKTPVAMPKLPELSPLPMLEPRTSELRPEPVVGGSSCGDLPEICIKDDPEPLAWYLKPWLWGMVAVVIAMAFLLVDVLNTMQTPVHGVEMPARPVLPKPEIAKPEIAKPEIAKPEIAKPEIAKPEIAKPEIAKPEIAKPEIAKPEIAKPEIAKPEIAKPEIAKPEIAKPGAGGIEVPKPDASGAPVLVKLKPKPSKGLADQKPLVPPVVVSPVVDLPEPIPAVKPKSAARLAIESQIPGLGASEVLDLFLKAGTLDERVPLMLTHTKAEELERSCLANRLPPVLRADLEYREEDLEGARINSYFTVVFDGVESGVNPQILLVRQLQGESPKVVVDPFLDLYGGRLQAFASKPSPSATTFEVYASALAHCKDGQVPGHQDKMTLSLQARDHGGEVARAYFGKKSAIAALLEDGSFRMSYGQALPCRVLLRWNADENPRQPYLEAVEIRAFEWSGE